MYDFQERIQNGFETIRGISGIFNRFYAIYSMPRHGVSYVKTQNERIEHFLQSSIYELKIKDSYNIFYLFYCIDLLLNMDILKFLEK